MADRPLLVLPSPVAAMDFERPKPARTPLPKDGPGNRWAYDWRGRPVNLWGLRKGKDLR
jgi:hypothetical protein